MDPIAVILHTASCNLRNGNFKSYKEHAGHKKQPRTYTIENIFSHHAFSDSQIFNILGQNTA